MQVKTAKIVSSLNVSLLFRLSLDPLCFKFHFLVENIYFYVLRSPLLKDKLFSTIKPLLLNAFFRLKFCVCVPKLTHQYFVAICKTTNKYLHQALHGTKEGNNTISLLLVPEEVPYLLFPILTGLQQIPGTQTGEKKVIIYLLTKWEGWTIK